MVARRGWMVVCIAAQCVVACVGEGDVDSDVGSSSLSGPSLVPTIDVAKTNVSGVGDTVQLYRDVDDGTSFSAADNTATMVRTTAASGTHTVGYSGGPTGTVEAVAVNFVAGVRNAMGSAQIRLYDGTTLIGTGPAHALPPSGWAHFTDTFSGLAVTSANNLRTSVTLTKNSGHGALRYTQIWIQAQLAGTMSDAGPPASDGGPPASDAGPPASDSGAGADAGSTGAPSVRVSGNRLVDSAGNTVRLLGVNRSGTQYACIEGWGFFDGPTDDAAIMRMKAWRMTAVRVSLNEDCWLAINGAPAAYSGTNYQNAIASFVGRLNAQGLMVILDLHWNAPGTQQSVDQQTMADRDHAPAFWQGVAARFASNHSVLFDLYNEPHPDSNRSTTAAWTCVRDGGSCPGVSFIAAGMQELVDAVRSTGATNPILVGGPQYAGDLTQWLAYRPTDPANQLVASIHIYGPDWAPCWEQACWDSVLAPLATQVPIVVGEMGNIDCTHSVIDPLMAWSDAHGVSYLAWSWIVGSCTGEPSLITNYDGTPTPYGVGLRDHLLSL